MTNTDKPTAALLIEFASALEAAGALARKIAEGCGTKVEVTIDTETVRQAACIAIHGIRGASTPSNDD